MTDSETILHFGNNFHPEFEGWLGIKDKGVYISFIESREKEKGNFSKLLEELKQKYAWIKIPTPSNLMRAIALRKGFVETKEFFPEPFNEWGEILLWKR